MINVVTGIIVIIIIFSIGFYFTLRNHWPQNTPAVLSAIAMKIAVPSLAIISIYDHFTPELLHGSVFYLLIIALNMILLFLTGKVFSKLLHLTDGKKSIFEISFMFQNAVFVGLPVIEVTFGHEGFPYLFTFYLVSMTMFWSLGAHQITKASQQKNKESSLKRIINPGTVGVVIGCLFVELRLTIPVFFYNAFRYLSALCVPLALLMIGSNLSSFAHGFPKIHKDELVMLCAKFIISPLYMFTLLNIFGVEGLAFKVFLLISALPCHTQTSILSEYYQVESAYAAKLVGLSTFVSLFTIPVFAWLVLGL